MRKVILFFVLMLGIWSCNPADELIGEIWIIEECTYNNSEVHFSAPEGLVILNVDGTIDWDLRFKEDGSITLPGINGPDVDAKWNIVDGQLNFEIDSAAYSARNKMNETPDELLSLAEPGSIPQARMDSLLQADSAEIRIWQRENPINIEELEEAMQVYGHPFNFHIKDDELILFSSTTELKARKSLPLEGLLRGYERSR